MSTPGPPERFCPECGARLTVVRVSERHWITIYECPRQPGKAYLKKDDLRFIFPLQDLSAGVVDRVRAVADDELDEAASRIRRVDYKTITIVDFERRLLGTA